MQTTLALSTTTGAPLDAEPSLRTVAESLGWTIAPYGESAGGGRKNVVSPEGVKMTLTAGEFWAELARREEAPCSPAST